MHLFQQYDHQVVYYDTFNNPNKFNWKNYYLISVQGTCKLYRPNNTGGWLGF